MINSFPVVKSILFLFILTSLLLPGCSKSTDVVISEIDSKTVTFREIKHMNNCGGKAESEQTVARSFTSSIDAKVGIEGGYNAGVDIKGKIETKYSQYHNQTSNITVKAPPGTNMEFVLQWTDNERAGNVTLEGKQAPYTVTIPISVELISSSDAGCPVTISDNDTQTFVTNTPTVPVANTYTPTPITQFITDLVIQSNSNRGTTFEIQKSGLYEIKYSDGFYSTGPKDAGGKQWRTVIFIYRQNSIQWGGNWNEPLDPSYAIGCRADSGLTDEQTEINCAKSMPIVQAILQAGDQLIFLAVDDQNSYQDNRGTVIVTISRKQ